MISKQQLLVVVCFHSHPRDTSQVWSYFVVWNIFHHKTAVGTYSWLHAWIVTLHEVWVVLLLLKKLLAVRWHIDNPRRNQSLHSYCCNRWANMLPGDSPYYSGAIRPPGDTRARWNWGVVTTERTGNELLQDKCAATWEMRKYKERREGVNGAITVFLGLILVYIYVWTCFTNDIWTLRCRRTHLYSGVYGFC